MSILVKCRQSIFENLLLLEISCFGNGYNVQYVMKEFTMTFPFYLTHMPLFKTLLYKCVRRL